MWPRRQRIKFEGHGVFLFWAMSKRKKLRVACGACSKQYSSATIRTHFSTTCTGPFRCGEGCDRVFPTRLDQFNHEAEHVLERSLRREQKEATWPPPDPICPVCRTVCSWNSWMTHWRS